MNTEDSDSKHVREILRDGAPVLLSPGSLLFPDYSSDVYDSPAESEFVWELTKHLAPHVVAETQWRTRTSHRRFRIDVVIRVPNCRPLIALEVDGREFHDYCEDLERDRALLEAALVPKIYRFRGCDVFHHLADVLHILSVLEPVLFSPRGRANLEALAWKSSRRIDDRYCDSFRRQYFGEVGEWATARELHPSVVTWRTRKILRDQEPLPDFLVS